MPSIHTGYWDPFFAACSDTQTVVCMHIGSSSKMPATSADAPVAVAATLRFGNAMASMSDFLFSGVLVRFPDLKLAYTEGQIGWIPYILERVDDVWVEHRAWGGVRDLVPEPPSTYYYRQIYGCFFRDHHGIDSLDKVGVDNITFETDYPHTDSTWPDTKEVATELMKGVPDDAVYKIMRGNAIRMLEPRPRLSAPVRASGVDPGRGVDGSVTVAASDRRDRTRRSRLSRTRSVVRRARGRVRAADHDAGRRNGCGADVAVRSSLRRRSTSRWRSSAPSPPA